MSAFPPGEALMLDPASRPWLRQLRRDGPLREAALGRLHARVAILAKLDQFRGDALFTTWARRFAASEVPGEIRRRLGHTRQAPADADCGMSEHAARDDLEERIEVRELAARVRSTRRSTTPAASCEQGRRQNRRSGLESGTKRPAVRPGIRPVSRPPSWRHD